MGQRTKILLDMKESPIPKHGMGDSISFSAQAIARTKDNAKLRIQIAALITRPMIPVTKPAEASPFAVLCLPTLPVEMAMMPRITPIRGINRDVRMLRIPVTREMVALLVGLCTATGTGAGVGDSFAKESAAVAPVGIGACCLLYPSRCV